MGNEDSETPIINMNRTQTHPALVLSAAALSALSAFACMNDGGALESIGESSSPADGVMPADADNTYKLPSSMDFFDREGRRWKAKRVVTYVTDTSPPQVKRPEELASPRLSDISIEAAATHIRPMAEIGGIEYELSWPDALELARKMRELESQSERDDLTGASIDSPDIATIQSAVVIGSDNRVNLASSSSSNLYRKTGVMFPGSSGCTCFKMINDHTCITTKHCVYNGGWLTPGSIQFQVGSSPLPAVPSGCYARSYGANESAVIAFRGYAGAFCDPATYATGFHPWATVSCTNLAPILPAYGASNWGFPGPPPFGWPYPTLSGHFNCQGYSGGNCWATYYNCDTSDGHSGSIVYRESDGKAVGIHYGGSGSFNFGTRLTSSIVGWMSSVSGF